MKKTVISLLMFLLLAVQAHSTVIDFTGGTVTDWDGTEYTTNGTFNVWGVDYYVEDGFKLDFIGAEENPFESIVGNYYGGTNDVIHGHWETGDYGGLTEIRVTQLDGNSFDLNYFVLTSNTDTGGAGASGNELAYINASIDGTNISYSLLLPPEDWGFSGLDPQIFLGSEFDNVSWFSFTVANAVDCFGMDNFYINEPAPIPEPSTFLLLGGGLAGLAFVVRRRKNS